MSGIHKHSEKNIQKWHVWSPSGKGIEVPDTGFLVSIPGQGFTQYAKGETVLGAELTLGENADKTIDLKLFSRVAKIASLSRIQGIEQQLPEFLSQTVFRTEMDKQNAFFREMLEKLDVKDLDVEDFLKAVAKLVTKTEFTILLSDFNILKQVVSEQKTKIIQLETDLSNVIWHLESFDSLEPKRLFDPMSGTYGGYFVDFPVPAGLKVFTVDVYQDTLKLRAKGAYTFAESGGVCTVSFQNGLLDYTELIDLECSFKKVKLAPSLETNDGIVIETANGEHLEV
jgi:hypothetical protein